MLKLFAVVLGGRANGCNIELHDVVFIVANNIEDSYPLLINKWFGIAKGLHMDSFVELQYVDGYEISVSTKPFPNEATLFFVNMGGYKKDYFGEVHMMDFFVCQTREEAVQKAKKTLLINDIYQQHCDDKVDVIDLLQDDIMALSQVEGYFIQIKKSDNLDTRLDIKSQYYKLDVPNLLNAAQLLGN